MIKHPRLPPDASTEEVFSDLAQLLTPQPRRRAAPPPDVEHAPPPVAPHAAQGIARVMVVGGSEQLHHVIQRVCQSLRCTLTVERRAQAAVSFIQEVEPDVVILGGGSQLPLARTLAESFPSLLLVMLDDTPVAEHALECWRIRAADYIPVNTTQPAELAARLQQVILRRMEQRALAILASAERGPASLGE